MIKTLNELTDLIIDYRGKTPLKLGKSWNPNGKHIALSAKNIKMGTLVNLSSCYHGDDDLYKVWMKDEVRKGDILITSEAPFGQVYYWNSDEKIILSQRLYCIHPRDINNKYLYYFMMSKRFQDELLSKATGSTVTGLRQPALLSCHIDVPSDDIQQHIVGTRRQA